MQARDLDLADRHRVEQPAGLPGCGRVDVGHVEAQGLRAHGAGKEDAAVGAHGEVAEGSPSGLDVQARGERILGRAVRPAAAARTVKGSGARTESHDRVLLVVGWRPTPCPGRRRTPMTPGARGRPRSGWSRRAASRRAARRAGRTPGRARRATGSPSRRRPRIAAGRAASPAGPASRLGIGLVAAFDGRNGEVRRSSAAVRPRWGCGGDRGRGWPRRATWAGAATRARCTPGISTSSRPSVPSSARSVTRSRSVRRRPRAGSRSGSSPAARG